MASFDGFRAILAVLAMFHVFHKRFVFLFIIS